MSKEGFRSLRVWQKGRELALLVYDVTRSDTFKRDFSLHRDRLYRAFGNARKIHCDTTQQITSDTEG